MNFRTTIEPFRIKSVEGVRFTTREEREAFARWAPRYDVFHFHFGTSFFYLAPRER